MKLDRVNKGKGNKVVNASERQQPAHNEEMFFPSLPNEHGFFASKSMGTGTEESVDSNTVVQRKENALPDNVQSKMESSFGQDFSTVSIHTNSDDSKNLNALAYTQGEEIHFAPGQFDPASTKGQELIGHELAHVVQQRQGRVAPTIQAKELSINEDKGLEQEADAMGRKAANAETVSCNSNALGIRNNIRTMQLAKSGVVQLAPVTTHYGEFKDKTFKAVSNYGVEIELEFHPGNNVDAKKIGLTQTVKGTLGGASDTFSPTRAERTTAAGLYIDRIDARNNPIYGGQQLGTTDPLSNTNLTGGNYKLGWKHPADKKTQEAYMYDKPTRPGRGNDSGQMFETTALAIEGTQEGTYYGSVQWGWTVDAAGTFATHSISKISDGVPSKSFMDAAIKWNNATSKGTVKTTKSPTTVYDATYAVAFTIPKDTEVTVDNGGYTNSNISYNLITIVSDGRTGKIKTADLKDQGTGDATVNLPVISTLVVNNPAGATLNDGLMGPWPYTDTLPQNTRLKIIDSSYIMGPFQTDSPFDYKAEVEVVDGPHIGKTGWLDYADLKYE